jgi:endonuclease/exonuclease/phosphatase family metal-dependent hydrolase
VLWARVDQLVVANCHLGIHRGEAPRQLAAALAALPSGPAVVLGDLNLHRHQVEPLAAAAGFEVVDVPPAFPAKGPVAAIDHVLVRGVGVRDIALDAERPVVSDHRPVVVELELDRYFRS